MSAPTPAVVELRDVQLAVRREKSAQWRLVRRRTAAATCHHGTKRQSARAPSFALILGIIEPTAGEIFFKQFDITRLSRRKLQQVRTRIGMVYQYSALLSSRNVRDNIALPLDELTTKTPDEKQSP